MAEQGNQPDRDNTFPNGIPGPQNPQVNEAASSIQRPSLTEEAIHRQNNLDRAEYLMDTRAKHQDLVDQNLGEQKEIVRDGRREIATKQLKSFGVGVLCGAGIVALAVLVALLNKKDGKK